MLDDNCFFQAASESQPMHSEIDQYKLIAKHAVNNMSKRVNKVVDKSSKVLVGKQLRNATYLRLTGREGECVFSSTAPEIVPTINVSYCDSCRPTDLLELLLYPIGRSNRATITLYPIGKPVRGTITLY